MTKESADLSARAEMVAFPWCLKLPYRLRGGDIGNDRPLNGRNAVDSERHRCRPCNGRHKPGRTKSVAGWGTWAGPGSYSPRLCAGCIDVRLGSKPAWVIKAAGHNVRDVGALPMHRQMPTSLISSMLDCVRAASCFAPALDKGLGSFWNCHKQVGVPRQHPPTGLLLEDCQCMTRTLHG